MGSFAITILFEPFDIQIFNADDIVFVDIHPGKLMKEIRSLIINSLMNLIQLIFELLAVIRTVLCS